MLQLSTDDGSQSTSESVYTPALTDTPRRRKLKMTVIRTQQNLQKRQKEIRRLRQVKLRLSKKVAELKDIIKTLKDRSFISEEDGRVLENVNVHDGGLKLNRKNVYSQEVKAFAVTLHYYSPKGYNYVRKKFNTCLPHPRTIQKWYENVDANAGFTKESLTAIANKQKYTNYGIICSLSIDEMAIRRRIEWDGKIFHGYVDIGANINTDDLREAKDALLFLVTAINAGWKVPVGYFFVDGVNGEQKHNLVIQCLKLIHETGVRVVSLTCDGCPANISMLNKLGCNINAENTKTSFEHPVTKQNVYAFLDACHMVKLIRNSLQYYETILDETNGKIQWRFFEKLHEVQQKEHLNLANKLSKEHIDFEKNKMKVKLATQLFSNSVADAITFCEMELRLDYFTNTTATTNFIKVINNLFDILNSKSMLQTKYKKPLCSYEKSEKFEFMENAKKYLRSLMLEDGTKVMRSGRKTGFVGMLTCIESSQQLYLELVEEEKVLFYIPMYKTSQDHLELLFCNIRSHGGANNNPTARQFKAIYKKILVHTELQNSEKGNCVPLEEISILHCSSALKSINNTSEKKQLCVEQQDELLETEYIANDMFFDNTLTEFTKQITTYIAGYVVKFLSLRLKCEDCLNELHSEDLNPTHRLIEIKNQTGLTTPSKDVILICEKVEKIFKNILSCGYIKSKHTKQYLVNQALHTCIGLEIFKNLDSHQFDQSPLENHSINLIKAVMEKYADIRLSYLSKKKTKQISLRTHYNKTILFSGQ